MDLQAALTPFGINLPQKISLTDSGEIDLMEGRKINCHYHLKENEKVIGKLVDGIPVKADLSSVHPSMEGPSMATFPDHDTTKIMNFGNGTGVAELFYKTPDSEAAYVTKFLGGKQIGHVDYSEKTLRTVRNAVDLKIGFNLTIINNNYYNNNYYKDSKSVQIRDIVLRLGSQILDNYKYNNPNLYEFDGQVWRIANKKMVGIKLYNNCLALETDKLALKYLGKPRIGQIMSSLITIVDDAKFIPTLKRHQFPLLGQILERNTLRSSTRNDNVVFHTGWTYDPKASAKHRGELDEFIFKLFPDEAERRLMLKFCASLLHGNRQEKKYVVLTDQRGGNNGKSTWVNFLCEFLGELSYNNNKLFLTQSVQAILHQANNKRLLVGSEFKSNIRLDESLLKKLTGMDPIRGRHFHREEEFSFFSQAGVMLVYNEGGDQAYIDRKVIFPMRSKFILGLDRDDSETNTYRQKIINTKKFYSSFLDMLIPLSCPEKR